MQAFDRNQITVQVSGFGFQNLGFAEGNGVCLRQLIEN
jgi:hypothetical protein